MKRGEHCYGSRGGSICRRGHVSRTSEDFQTPASVLRSALKLEAKRLRCTKVHLAKMALMRGKGAASADDVLFWLKLALKVLKSCVPWLQVPFRCPLVARSKYPVNASLGK